jgi:SPP1 family predicted phage head-tail adaptor
MSADPSTWRCKLQLQKPTETQDAAGAVVQAWATLKTVMGSVDPIRASEYFAAKSIGSTVDHEIWTWDVDGITPKYRVLFGTRVFEITQAFHNVTIEDRAIRGFSGRGRALMRLIVYEVTT